MADHPAHEYTVTVRWTGDQGSGTSSYRAYGRDHEVTAPGKTSAIAASSDPAFRGDPARWNPEELLVAAAAQCHLLWYLHLAAEAGVVVVDYVDSPVGILDADAAGVGQFREVVLRPAVTITDPALAQAALDLHDEVGARCAIARSVAFPVRHQPAPVTVRPAG
jgi:organic hydroperoxide reductase OsmC/OhrA